MANLRKSKAVDRTKVQLAVSSLPITDRVEYLNFKPSTAAKLMLRGLSLSDVAELVGKQPAAVRREMMKIYGETEYIRICQEQLVASRFLLQEVYKSLFFHHRNSRGEFLPEKILKDEKLRIAFGNERDLREHANYAANRLVCPHC